MTAATKKRVLVVDDSSLMRRLISEIVASDPDLVVVDTAENGRVALQKVREHAPDVVLLDIEMPELSGLDTLRHLRLRSAAKVVILSHLGHEGSRVRGQALRLGAAEVIDKPTAAVSPDLRRTRGQLILETLRRVLDLPLAQVADEALPREGALASVSVAAVSVLGLAALTERLAAAALVARLNHDLGVLEEVLRHHGGIIDARVGGTIFAVFGVPRPRADHASHAVLAARELLGALGARAPGAAGEAPLDVGVTVVTGLVLAGELGPTDARRYRTLGGALDQAARLAHANEDYGADLIVCAQTLAQLVPAPTSRRLDLLALDADAAPLELHELHTARTPQDPRVLATYARGLELEEAGRLAEAAQAFAAVLELRPGDRAAARLLARCRVPTTTRSSDEPA